MSERGLSGSKRKMEYDGGNVVKGRRRGVRAWIKGKSARHARCFRSRSGLFTTAAISSPSSYDERSGVPREVKDRDIASLCARMPFPPFIYLRLSAAGDPRISLGRLSLFSGCSIIPR